MPLRPPTPPPKDQRAWDQWARGVDVIPDEGSVTTDRIVDDAVTNAKLRNSAALSVIGNPTGSPADPQDIAAGTDGHYLRRSGGGVAFGAIADADLPSTIARDTEVAAAITAHEAASDPHPTYTTAAELTAGVSAGIAAHVALADPHPVYLTQTEGDARYLELTDSANPSASVGLTAVNGSATTYLRSDGAPALSQSIAPTWTGKHIFSLDGTETTRVGPSAAVANLATFNTATLSAIWAQVALSSQEPLDLHNAATSGDNRFAFFYTEASPTVRGGIDYNRAGGVVRFNTTSDERLKTNIDDAQSAVSIIEAIKVRQFDWKEPGHDHIEHGFIAQELASVQPHAVSAGDVWQVDNSKLVPVLVKALQEALERIKVLERR